MSAGRFNLSDYVTVQERINQFWQDNPTGRILTELVSDPADWERCRYRAFVYRDADDKHPAATGYAFEQVTERGPNQTSHEENCETSAIGRALANLGYATSHKQRPFREEMGKVERGQDAPAKVRNVSAPKATQGGPLGPANPEKIKQVLKEANAAGWSGEDLALWMHNQNVARYGVLTDNDLSALRRDIVNDRKPLIPSSDDADLQPDEDAVP